MPWEDNFTVTGTQRLSVSSMEMSLADLLQQKSVKMHYPNTSNEPTIKKMYGKMLLNQAIHSKSKWTWLDPS